MNGVFCNIDCDCFFTTPLDGRPGDSGEAVDRYVDRLADAGVGTLLVNTNARRTNYRSAVWDAFWDGYEPAGADTQPFLAAVPDEQAARYRRTIGNMWTLHQAGVDYPGRMMAAARRRGLQAWISLRMNDVHYGNAPEHPFHGRFWREHPGLFLGKGRGYFATALDYAHSEVRAFYLSLVAESLDRYDLDGLELDFMREPFLFARGSEVEGGRLLTDWLCEVRRLVRSAAARLGHAVRLGVRVPSNPDTAARLGLDAGAWARAGLVDLVVPAPRWATLEFDMPLPLWRERLAGTGAALAGGLEIRLQPIPDGPASLVTPAQASGAATAVLAGGADAVYLFNFFPSQHPGWPAAEYARTLRAMASLSALSRLPRRHAITYRDIVAPGEAYCPPLPAAGASLRFRLPTGPRPPADWRATLEIGLDPVPGQGRPAVTVNGVACPPSPEEAAAPGGAPGPLRHVVPVSALSNDGLQQIALEAVGGAPVRVVSVELSLAPEAI
jgi:hypothetical protein